MKYLDAMTIEVTTPFLVHHKEITTTPEGAIALRAARIIMSRYPALQLPSETQPASDYNSPDPDTVVARIKDITNFIYCTLVGIALSPIDTLGSIYEP